MRDYGKVAPQFWTGDTGKKLKLAGPEAVIVGLYLMTCPHANMIGLYYLPALYVAHETGLGMEGASKGLAGASEAGFCTYDGASEYVFVHAMARFQIAESLKADDNRCKGIENELAKVPQGPLVLAFRAIYGDVFNLKNVSPSEAPPKPRAGTRARTGTKEKKPSAGKVDLKTFLAECEVAGELPIPADDPIYDYAESIGLPDGYLALAWGWFKESRAGAMQVGRVGWRAHFRDAVRGNWPKMWYAAKEGGWALTTVGEQARLAAA